MSLTPNAGYKTSLYLVQGFVNYKKGNSEFYSMVFTMYYNDSKEDRYSTMVSKSNFLTDWNNKMAYKLLDRTVDFQTVAFMEPVTKSTQHSINFLDEEVKKFREKSVRLKFRTVLITQASNSLKQLNYETKVDFHSEKNESDQLILRENFQFKEIVLFLKDELKENKVNLDVAYIGNTLTILESGIDYLVILIGTEYPFNFIYKITEINGSLKSEFLSQIQNIPGYFITNAKYSSLGLTIVTNNARISKRHIKLKKEIENPSSILMHYKNAENFNFAKFPVFCKFIESSQTQMTEFRVSNEETKSKLMI